MLEKLLENWLDSASERSYQAVFVQMLAADGYRVLHSTRHCTLEYGKDVLAVAPDGVGCAFQLKGDPRGRMNVESFRKMQTQVVQLLTQRPSFPGFPAGPYRAYLVSNGEFNEEVQVAAREINDSSYPAMLELWSRGTLLDLCKRHAASLWPSEIADTKALLELYMTNAGDPLPVEILDGLLSSILSVPDRSLKSAELSRAVSSACWATGIGISRFAERGNHYAVAVGWMLCWSLIRATYVGKSRKISRIEEAVSICESAVLDALTELWEEVRERENLGEGSPLVDMDIFHWRVTVLVGLLSVLAFASVQRNVLGDESLAALAAWLISHKEKAELWGEGAVAQLFPWIAFKVSVRDHDEAKALLLTVLSQLIGRNLAGDETALPTPHYSFEEIKRDRIGVRKAAGLSLSDRETFRGSSYCAEALLRSATLLGYIDEVKALWPHFTKLGHRCFEFTSSEDYWTLRAQRGAEVTRIYPSTYEVAKLREEIVSSGSDVGVAAWPEDLWLVLMWWQVAPHRFNSSAACKVLSLSRSFEQSFESRGLSLCD
ncbi:hypothetical protein E2F46_16475 [Luteimonas aestuarii]|uniref:Uncharacterized protein n=1 Tax=Luteimonas aestuarii TaxID=453837 RepID=A0A4R5TSQ1_9GAMM|nr:hypothetical protein [Luteimonas aestuarii]TDK19962.1 hypothetical protein E2F46_16475 [Luteimonas aestuarii]